MASAPSEGTSVRRFLELLEAAQLLEPEDWRALLSHWPDAKRDIDAAELARALVTQRVLTKHQAASLYQQRTKVLGIASYAFLDRLGTGGSGSVYKARHRQTRDIVAVKVLNLSGSRSADALKRFQREAETAARLNHPNIVRALESGESGGQYYTVMEFVAGTDLSTYVKQQGPLAYEQAAQCIVDVARALAYAHGEGIIHRDIKPANLMFAGDGKIKVLDMGLARLQDPAAAGNDQAAEGLTQTGQVMGTVDYMAPEQALHTRLADARADVYSLGCTFYRLATGDVPYDADSMVAKILAHRENPIPSLRKKNPKVPPAFDVVLQRMLAKKPEDRYQSMNEVADDLQRALQGIPVAPLKHPAVAVGTAVEGVDPSSLSLGTGSAVGLGSSIGMGSTVGRGGAGATRARALPQAAALSGEPAALKPARRGTPVWMLAVAGLLLVGLLGGAGWWFMNQGRIPTTDESEVLIAVAPVPRSVPVASAKPTATASATTSMPTALPSATVFKPAVASLVTNTSAPPTQPTAAPTSIAASLITVATATSAPGVTPSATPTATSPPSLVVPGTNIIAQERAYTAWCIQQGLGVNVYDYTNGNGGTRTIRRLEEIPTGHFAALTVYLSSSTPVTSDLLAKLSTGPHVAGLYLTSVQNIEPGSLQTLSRFPQLEVLGLANSAFGDADAVVLRSFGELRYLMLTNSRVTDACLDVVAGLPKLEILDLTNLPITDDGIAKLTRSTSLRRLYLNGTRVTDAGIAALAGIPNLQTLHIQSTAITDAGRQRLATSLPQCQVDGSRYISSPRPPTLAGLGPLPTAGEVAAVEPPAAMPTGTATAPVPAFEPPKRLAVPETTAAEAALKLIRDELHKDAYAAAKKPEERLTLGRKLYTEATQLLDDPVGRYVLLREARDLGADGGDVGLIAAAAGDAEAAYEVDALVWLAEACEAAQKKVQPRAICKSLADGLLPKIDEALEKEKFDVAPRLMAVTMAMMRKAQDTATTKAVVERNKRFDAERKQFEEVVKARETLKENADDPAANLAVGKYLCFGRARWDEGLKHLAKGSDPALQELAEKSIPVLQSLQRNTPPTIAGDLSTLADLWWSVGEKAARTAQKDYLLGALYVYEKAATQNTGLGRQRIDKRIADARTALGDAAPTAPATAVASLPGFAPPSSGGTTVPPPQAPGVGDAATQRFIAWTFQHNGYLYVRYPQGSKFVYNPADFATMPSFQIVGARFRSSRNAILNDADIDYLVSQAWLTQVLMDRMPIGDRHVAKFVTIPALRELYLGNCTQVTDACAPALAKAAQLSILELSSTGITDQSLPTIGAMVGLQSLHLTGCRVTDVGLAALRNLSGLDSLYLDATGVTDTGLVHLRDLRDLDYLRLSNTRITGQGLAALSGTTIFTLYLSDSAVNDAGLDAISRIPSLSSLYLQNTPITDSGAAKLAALANLNYLDVSGCRLTDAAMAAFANLPRLSTLRVGRTQISPIGVQALRSRLPNCQVYTN